MAGDWFRRGELPHVDDRRRGVRERGAGASRQDRAAALQHRQMCAPLARPPLFSSYCAANGLIDELKLRARADITVILPVVVLDADEVVAIYAAMKLDVRLKYFI